MRYVKTFGLAVAAAALMAWVGAGTASATEITCGTTHHTRCTVGQSIHATSIGKAVLHTPNGNVECNSTVAGPVSTAGSATSTASGIITTLDWTNCGGDTVTTLALGNFEVHTDPEGQATNGNGILTSSGMRVTYIHLGVHCIFETFHTQIGTVTGSTNTGGHAVVHVKATIPIVGGSSGVFCGSSVTLTAVHTVTTPATLVIH